MVGDRTGYFRENRGCKRNGNQRIWQHVNRVRVLVRGIAGHVERIDAELLLRKHRRVGGRARDYDIGELVDYDNADTPSRDRTHGTQADAAKSELRTVFQSDFGQRNE